MQLVAKTGWTFEYIYSFDPDLLNALITWAFNAEATYSMRRMAEMSYIQLGKHRETVSQADTLYDQLTRKTRIENEPKKRVIDTIIDTFDIEI